METGGWHTRLVHRQRSLSLSFFYLTLSFLVIFSPSSLLLYRSFTNFLSRHILSFFLLLALIFIHSCQFSRRQGPPPHHPFLILCFSFSWDIFTSVYIHSCQPRSCVSLSRRHVSLSLHPSPSTCASSLLFLSISMRDSLVISKHGVLQCTKTHRCFHHRNNCCMRPGIFNQPYPPGLKTLKSC